MNGTHVNSTIIIGALVAAVVLLNPSDSRADGATLYAAKTCVACHGPDGKTPLLPEYPKIAGQGAAYAARQMADIKSGARANGSSAVMKAIMTMVSDEEIAELAKYVETLAP